jgi:Zn-finger nucleic acid-binding protein
MANYPKELTDLLEQYLTDGVMTAKERGVLLRKAEAMNVDKDEFDLYIDAEIQKIDQKADAIKRQSKGKLCPFCDASIPVLADKCPECGGSITPEATKELEEIIEKLEDALVDFKSGKDFEKSRAEVERYIRKAEIYYESNPKAKKLLGAVKSEMKTTERKAKTDNIAKYVKWVIGVILFVILILFMIEDHMLFFLLIETLFM